MKCECCMDCYKIDCCDGRCIFQCEKCNMNKNNTLKGEENILEEFKYTEDGYIVSNGQYIGLKDDSDWDWYGNIELARLNLKPIINMNIIKDIKDYIEFVQTR